jgi:hypothetical protein
MQISKSAAGLAAMAILPTANLVFSIGTIMAERSLPAVAFCALPRPAALGDVFLHSARAEDAAVTLLEGEIVTKDPVLTEQLARLYRSGLDPQGCALVKNQRQRTLNLSCGVEGPAIVIINNVNYRLDSPGLCKALTYPFRISLRISSMMVCRVVLQFFSHSPQRGPDDIPMMQPRSELRRHRDLVGHLQQSFRHQSRRKHLSVYG